MRLRSLLVIGATALMLLSGCAPTPEPEPKPSASPSASATPTPSPEPVTDPEAAFDVTCEDVAATMASAPAASPARPARRRRTGRSR